MSSTGKSQDISNCLSANFDKNSNGNSPGSWSVCYNPVQKTLSLSVMIEPSGSIMEPTSTLVSTIDSTGLTEMINFLYQVNVQLQKQQKGGGGQ